MKIDSSYTGMESARSYASYERESARFSAIEAGGSQGWDTGGYSFSQLLDFAKDGKEEFDKNLQVGRRPALFGIKEIRQKSDVPQQRHLESIRQACIMYFIRWLHDGFGYRRIKGDSQGSFDAQYLYAEKEEVSFHTQGHVQTSDGRTIDFDLSLYMGRSFCQYAGIKSSTDMPPMTDPLVINIDAPIAGVSDQKFTFDLDCDGTPEEISSLSEGTGFLALDKNGDGFVNDGSELFGTKSGDGFYDLSEYDADGNGWIDENDDVFDRLKIWCRDQNGSDILYTLKEAGVGAICLQKASTDFSLGSMTDNSINARIRSTGIFLYENGGVGTMNHLDLAR